MAGIVVNNVTFTACRFLYPFQRYSRSKSKVVVKRTKFWTVFALPNFKGAVLAFKSCTRVITPISGTSRGKVLLGYFSWLQRSWGSYAEANSSFEKNVRGTPSQVGCALVRLGHSVARVKIWGRSTPYRGQNMVSRKSRFGWVWFGFDTPVL